MHLLIHACALALAPAASAAPPPWPVLRVQDLQAEFDALAERLDQAQEEFYGKLRALYADVDEEQLSETERSELEAKAAAIYATDPSPAFALEFAALGDKAAGSQVALECWLKVLDLDRGASESALRDKALAKLLSDHLQATELERLGFMLDQHSLGAERYLEVMTTLREKSPHAAVQASAVFALANDYLQSKQTGRASELYRELMAKHAETKALWGGTYGAMAERALYELEHLQIGMVAPEFESIDETGVKFKLSDYRGKVVVLDFWGYW